MVLKYFELYNIIFVFLWSSKDVLKPTWPHVVKEVSFLFLYFLGDITEKHFDTDIAL